MSLKEEIEKLVILQNIDTEIKELTNYIENDIPLRIKQAREYLNEKKSSLKLFEEKVKELQLKKKNAELDLSSKEESIKKAQSQLYQLKTNKEYQAKLTEIASLKADLSVLEENILKIMELIDEAEKKLKEKKENIAKEEEKFRQQENQINKEKEATETKIEQLKNKRKIAVEQIDKTLLNKYEGFLKTRYGLAIVPVENGTCGGCRMSLTPQTINEIKMYKDLIICNSCIRILYLPEDVNA